MHHNILPSRKIKMNLAVQKFDTVWTATIVTCPNLLSNIHTQLATLFQQKDASQFRNVQPQTKLSAAFGR